MKNYLFTKSAYKLGRRILFAEARGFFIATILAELLCCLIYMNEQLLSSHLSYPIHQTWQIILALVWLLAVARDKINNGIP